MFDIRGVIARQQVERILIASFLVFAIFFGTTRFKKVPAKKEDLKDNFDVIVKETKALSAEQLPRIEKVEYIAGELRDPFKSPLDEKPKEVFLEKIELPKITFQGMVFGNRLSQAIIDNKVYKVGDTVQEVEIIAITKEGVRLKYKGREFIVQPK